MRSNALAVSVLAVAVLASGCGGEKKVVEQNTASAPAPSKLDELTSPCP
jgi:hypothetical protein